MSEPTEGRGTSRERLPSGMLRATCSACGFTYYAPDKGMGRANLAAWESRHGSNCDVSAPASPSSPEEPS